MLRKITKNNPLCSFGVRNSINEETSFDASSFYHIKTFTMLWIGVDEGSVLRGA